MATVLTKPQTNAAKVEAKLSHELAQVTSRIRGTDLLSGGLLLVTLVLGYTLVAVLADKLLDLPPWARLGGLAAFLAALALAAWLQVVRPLRSRINPRYAARKVEQTLADGKNAVINWVDLQDQNLPESVRAAVGAKAAEGVADAEVAGVAESRRVLVLLASVGLLVAGLAVFFLLVKSAPFFSLLNRAYNPFTASGIATRTSITLDEPAGGDVTVTSGDPVTVRVTLAGTLPDSKSPDRARLLVRYNPESEEFEEIDLDPAGSKREFAAKLPASVVQNGFRYRVAAGDASTSEFVVTVRTRPLLLDFAVKYEYPAYTRLEPEATTDPRVEGYRGTQVTLTARANRPVKDARLVIEALASPVAGVVSPATPQAVTFVFPLEESSNYRVTWMAADGEVSESAAYPIRVRSDKAPDVAITSPKEEETSLPADGSLKVDGVAADDFGLVSMTLRVRLAGPTPVEAEPKKYRGGKSFRRASDQSDPTVLEYKDSVKLSTLKTKAGEALKFEPGAVLEYWLEAADNCTAPTANVGKSKVQRVKVAPPPPPAQQNKQEKDQAERGKQEQDHQAKQDKQQGDEKREPKQPRPENVEKKPQDGQSEPQQGQPQDGQPKPGDAPKSGQGQPPKGGNDPQPNPDTPPMTKPPEGGNTGDQAPPKAGNEQPAETKPPEPGKSGDATPKSKGATGADQAKREQSPDSGQSGESKPGDRNLEDQAKKVENALNEQQKQPGATRPPESNPEAGDKPMGEPDATQTGQPKPQPGDAAKPPDATAKPQPGGEGQPKPDATPAEGKPQGNGPQPKPEASEPKPEGGARAGGGEPQAKPEAKPGQAGETKAGQEKPSDASANPPSGKPGDEAKPMRDPQAGTGKPEEGAAKPGEPKAAKPPQDGASKGEPKGQPGEGAGQPQEKPSESAKPGETGQGQPKAGGAKPQTPPRPGDAKPTPADAAGQDGQPTKPAEQKPTAGDDAGQPKPEGKPQPNPDATGKPPAGGKKPEPGEKATEKPTAGGGTGDKNPDAKELEQAVKDLKSGDPAKRQAARDKLDKAIGKEKREAAEAKADRLEKDLKGDDKAKQEAARKEIEAMAKEAAKGDDKKTGATGENKENAGRKGDQPGDTKQPTPEQLKEAQKLQDDLTSKDDATRQAAEKKVDDAVGKDKREQLQRDLQDAQSGDPAKAEAAKQRLEARGNPKGGNKGDGTPRGPGERPTTPGDKLQDDPKNRRKTADLQLKPFEEAKKDAALLKKLGYTPEQYDEFLKGYAEMLKRQEEAAAKPEVLPVPGEAGGPATIRLGSGAAKGPLDKKPGGTDTAGTGVGTAPPGFTEAQRRFAEEAAKLRRPAPK